jgi:hypothetical protein
MQNFISPIQHMNPSHVQYVPQLQDPVQLFQPKFQISCSLQVSLVFNYISKVPCKIHAPPFSTIQNKINANEWQMLMILYMTQTSKTELKKYI